MNIDLTVTVYVRRYLRFTIICNIFQYFYQDYNKVDLEYASELIASGLYLLLLVYLSTILGSRMLKVAKDIYR